MRFARGAFWSLAGTGVCQGLTLLALMITARILGREVFGKLGIIQSTVAMLGTLAGTAMGLTATKFVAHYRDAEPERTGRVIGLNTMVSVGAGGIMAGILYMFAGDLAGGTLKSPEMAGPLRTAALLLFFHAWNAAQQGVLAGFEAFGTIALVNSARGLVTVLGTVWATIHWQLSGAVWGLTVAAALACGSSALAIRLETRRQGLCIRWLSAWSERRVLWCFSLPAVLGGAMVAPINWLVCVFLAHQPHGYAELGIFNAANQWRLGLAFIPNVLTQSALPILANLFSRGDRRPYKKAIILNVILSTCISVAIAVPLLVGAKLVMRSYGRGFESGTLTLVLMLLAGVLNTVCSVVGGVIASSGRMWFSLLLNLLWALALLLTAALFVPLHGAAGLGAAYLLSYVLHSAWQSVYLVFALKRDAPPANQ
jgi:O-antigen/teichoic acid export membrane protein